MADEYQVQIDQDPRTGIVKHEEWRLDERLHRIAAPAVIDRDPITGNVVREAWYSCDLLHRMDGPAEILRDRLTGEVIGTRFFRFGGEVSEHHGKLNPPGP